MKTIILLQIDCFKHILNGKGIHNHGFCDPSGERENIKFIFYRSICITWKEY